MLKKWFLLLLLMPIIAQAGLYQTVLPDGSISFSDTPGPGSQYYDLMDSNVSGFSGAVSTESASVNLTGLAGETTAANASAYSSIVISQPLDQTTVQNQTPIAVVVTTQPALKPGDLVKLMVDGVAQGAAQTSLQFTLTDLARGTHQLQAAIVDAEGKTLKSSLSITLFKQQATLLLPVGKAAS